MRSPDVLVVGGGSCGSVLAARLSEDPERQVLLLEEGAGYAGTGSMPRALLDAGTLPLARESGFTREYESRLAEGVPARLVRGRVLGGSGAVNGAYFVRATPSDLDGWGSGLWTYVACLPYFRRSEHDRDFGGGRHGDSGPIPVLRDRPERWTRTSEAFVGACLAQGFPLEDDKNGAGAAGIGPIPMNRQDGVRVGPGLGYLLPALGRANLTVRTGVRVIRLKLLRDRVVGVEVLGTGGVEEIAADQIVLSAGAIASPTVLFHSGIGPPGVLRAAGIPVLHALDGVGQGFTDHPELVIPYRPAHGEPAPDSLPVLQVALNASDWELRPYTRPFAAMIAGAAPGPPMFGVALMRTAGTGALWPLSADPARPPAVDHRYLDHPHDRSALLRAAQLARHLFATRELSGVATLPDDPLGDEWVRAHLTTSQHLSGTCRMGPADDPASVVDDHCRLHGLDGLRIVDTSVMPTVPSRGPHATAVMLAERAAALLTPMT